MKTKRHSRVIALLLVLCLCGTMLPGMVNAQDDSNPSTTDKVMLSDILTSHINVQELYDPLTESAVPDIIGYNQAIKKDHISRLYSDEGENLNKVVFLNKDGTKTMYLFDFPVKYVDSDGETQDISLDIADSTSGAFQTAGNSTVTTFSAQASNGISLSGNGTEITLIPIMPAASTGTQSTTARGNAGNLGSISDEETVVSHVATRIDEKTIQYRYDSKTTIEYSLTYTGFKEDIVVSEYTGQTEYAFTLRTGGYGLEEIDGSYFLVDDEGSIKATIGDIIIFTADDRNNTMGSIVPTTIVENEEYLLTIIVDPDFLADENTAYPIRIDPTVEINYDNNGADAIQDATVYTDDTTNGYLGSLFVGLKQNGGIARILMKFPGLDFDDLDRIIAVQSATVTLRDLLCESTALTVYCYAYDGNRWDESTVCWDNTIAVSPYYLSTHLDTKAISYSIGAALSDPHRYSFDITEVVQGWYDGTYSKDDGIVFKASNTVENGNTYNWKTLGSYNRASYKPSLQVTYDTYYYNSVTLDNVPTSLRSTTEHLCIPCAITNVAAYWSVNGYSGFNCDTATEQEAAAVQVQSAMNAAGSASANRYIQSGFDIFNHNDGSIAYGLRATNYWRDNEGFTVADVINEINSGRPVLLGFAGTADSPYSGGHMTVCTGYVINDTSYSVYVSDAHVGYYRCLPYKPQTYTDFICKVDICIK